MKTHKFDAYACVGDSITWQTEGFDVTATLEFDADITPRDFDCYSPIKSKQWRNDEWFFVGVVMSVSKNDVLIDDHCASLWGIECNYNKKSNRYLSEVAQYLESEALDYAKSRAAKMIEALL